MYYKLLIVDDEQKIRDGLRMIVNWNELGFELVGDACNGVEAMKFIDDNLYPDVILTDIRMPLMGGIELMETVRKCNYDIQFILLSGYDYFEYAEKAIEFGAFGYILKPTKLQELKNKFLALKDKLDNEIKKKKILFEGTSLLRDNYIKDILYQNYDEDTFLYETPSIVILKKDKEYCILILKIVSDVDSKSILKLKNMADELTGINYDLYSIIIDAVNIVLILSKNMKNQNNISEQGIESLAFDIMKATCAFGVDAVIGMGGVHKGIDKICLSYKQALEAMKASFFRGLNIVIKFSSKNHDALPLKYPFEYEKQLISAIEKGDKSQSINTIEKLFISVLSNESLEQTQVFTVCIEMIVAISRYFNNISNRIENIFDESKIIYKKVSDFETLIQLKQWFKERILVVIDTVLDEMDDNDGRIVKYIKKYIDQKYHEQITLSSLVDTLYMNPDYISRLFKKETGMGFNEYLTNYRIEKAKEFLKDVSCKSYEVGFSVGYQDASYFSKIFKKVTGKSISEYREKSVLKSTD